MIITTIISQFWGIIFITVGVLFFVKKGLLQKMFEDAKDEKFAMNAGFVSLILGVATWLLSGRSEILLKLIALTSFVKGISLMAFPSWRYKVLKPLEANKNLVSILLTVVILLGLYLLFNEDLGMRHYRRF